jgi:hypothetical protein
MGLTKAASALTRGALTGTKLATTRARRLDRA